MSVSDFYYNNGYYIINRIHFLIGSVNSRYCDKYIVLYFR